MFVCIPRKSGVLVEKSGQERGRHFPPAVISTPPHAMRSLHRQLLSCYIADLFLYSFSLFFLCFFRSYYFIPGTRYGGCARHRPRLIRYSPRVVTAILITTSYRLILQPPSIDNGGRRRYSWIWQWRGVSGSIMEVCVPLFCRVRSSLL